MNCVHLLPLIPNWVKQSTVSWSNKWRATNLTLPNLIGFKADELLLTKNENFYFGHTKKLKVLLICSSWKMKTFFLQSAISLVQDFAWVSVKTRSIKINVVHRGDLIATNVMETYNREWPFELISREMYDIFQLGWTFCLCVWTLKFYLKWNIHLIRCLFSILILVHCVGVLLHVT